MAACFLLRSSVVEQIFTTEDTEVHRGAQGKMKRTFNEEDFL
jgi:hypothetical protein